MNHELKMCEEAKSRRNNRLIETDKYLLFPSRLGRNVICKSSLANHLDKIIQCLFNGMSDSSPIIIFLRIYCSKRDFASSFFFFEKIIEKNCL